MPTPTAQKSDTKKTLVIPDEVNEKFGQYVELIQGSRSMDDDERQYWIDVLPIMSDDQLKNLMDILENERKQIEAAEENYSNRMDNAVQKANRQFDEAAYLEKKKARMEAEQRQEKEETKREQAILEELENL
jgi:transcriptional regulator with GAF, ATPase, and Fis domain